MTKSTLSHLAMAMRFFGKVTLCRGEG